MPRPFGLAGVGRAGAVAIATAGGRNSSGSSSFTVRAGVSSCKPSVKVGVGVGVGIGVTNWSLSPPQVLPSRGNAQFKGGDNTTRSSTVETKVGFFSWRSFPSFPSPHESMHLWEVCVAAARHAYAPCSTAFVWKRSDFFEQASLGGALSGVTRSRASSWHSIARGGTSAARRGAGLSCTSSSSSDWVCRHSSAPPLASSSTSLASSPSPVVDSRQKGRHACTCIVQQIEIAKYRGREKVGWVGSRRRTRRSVGRVEAAVIPTAACCSVDVNSYCKKVLRRGAVSPRRHCFVDDNCAKQKEEEEEEEDWYARAFLPRWHAKIVASEIVAPSSVEEVTCHGWSFSGRQFMSRAISLRLVGGGGGGCGEGNPSTISSSSSSSIRHRFRRRSRRAAIATAGGGRGTGDARPLSSSRLMIPCLSRIIVLSPPPSSFLSSCGLIAAAIHCSARSAVMASTLPRAAAQSSAGETDRQRNAMDSKKTAMAAMAMTANDMPEDGSKGEEALGSTTPLSPLANNTTPLQSNGHHQQESWSSRALSSGGYGDAGTGGRQQPPASSSSSPVSSLPSEEKSWLAVAGQSFNMAGTMIFVHMLMGNRYLALPHISVPDIRWVDWHALRKAGFVGAIFDKDNTLTVPYENNLYSVLQESVSQCKEAFEGRIAILSNSAGLIQFDPHGVEAKAVEDELGVPVLRHEAKKPAGGYESLEKHFGCDRSALIMVGDRYFTDMVFGNRHGLLTIYTAPLTNRGEPFIVRQVQLSFLLEAFA
ncbi:hypothetical protein CBR_g66789 [Chara braunii]|uniref:Phosphatidylglycerophosphatase GEP4, mitochondrial n=1 Tax=Chara braunii TaxID=69332 RepID=A0A388K9P0_CHABU|nr:hypothetical protein CBR_g66789 [Chara braunii]|eukprot:GBG66653.1 hypothetical protein CBR_g66789 [Chara braunii]